MKDISTIAVYFLDTSRPVALAGYAGLMSRARAQRLAAYTTPDAIAEGCAAELLLVYAYSKYKGAAPAPVEWEAGEYGKPYITGDAGTHFNLSHTRGMMMLAISTVPVGVDIERVYACGPGAARRIFTQEEYAGYLTLPDEERRIRFFERWTVMEAYHKLSGRGLTLPMRPLGEQAGLIGDGPDAVRLVRFSPREDIRAALCARGAFETEVAQLDAGTLLSAL